MYFSAFMGIFGGDSANISYDMSRNFFGPLDVKIIVHCLFLGGQYQITDSAKFYVVTLVILEIPCARPAVKKGFFIWFYGG